jgi:hypothetical protein
MRARKVSGRVLTPVIAAGAVLLFSVPIVQSRGQTSPSQASPATEQPAFPGMDESVNETLAEEAGMPSREPFINTEAMGELWNLLLLAAGAVCGFVVGRYWDQIWGRRPGPPSS